MAGLHRGARKKSNAGSCTSCRASGAGGIANLTRCAVSPNCQRIESPKRCATCRRMIEAPSPDGWSYGAHRKTLWRIRRCTPEEERLGKIDSFSGNCVCVPREWIERIGLPHDHLFPHGIADLDYGLRLRAAGAPLRALPEVVAENANPSRSAAESWLISARPMRDIWHDFHSPKSFLYFPAWRRVALRH